MEVIGVGNLLKIAKADVRWSMIMLYGSNQHGRWHEWAAEHINELRGVSLGRPVTSAPVSAPPRFIPMVLACLVGALFVATVIVPFVPRLHAQAAAIWHWPREDAKATVQPGDLIRLKIWREPDMSGDIRVDEDGIATLPRIGPLPVADLPADSLKRILLRSYAKFLRDPSVDIAVLRRVTILGAVRTPNVYHIEPTMTVADALALAGGASPEGKQDQVELRRRAGAIPLKLSRGARLADTPLRSGDELYVPERSWFSRNSAVVIGGVGTAASILFLLLKD
jgi:protein involved in polysaccharide export with SLBB domain